MISYLIIFLILWAFVGILMEFEWDSCVGALIGNAVIALVFLWPIHWGLQHIHRAYVDSSNEIEAEHQQWNRGMQAQGCKVTGFVGHSYYRPVWTCPDGSAVLQPFQ